MPADYSSTARALALPLSPPRSPLQQSRGDRPSRPWGHQANQSLNRSGTRRGSSFIDSVINNVERMSRRMLKMAEKLSPVQMALSAIASLAIIVLAILFLVFSEKIFAWLEPVAEKWSNLRGGWLILWAMTFATAFPPVIGYSTCLTLAGFVYGFPWGWPIVASATVLGSTCSFVASRTLLSGFVNRLTANDSRFEALSLVLKHDGLSLLIAIRLCPLPYSISNGAISTFPTVSPMMFALATAAASPKLLIAIFIGSRLAAIARSGDKMDTATKVINWASIIFGVLLGVGTGYFIYSRTLARSRQIEAEERDISRQPSIPSGEFSDDPDEQSAAALIRNDQVDFLDPGMGPEGYRDEVDEGLDDDNVFKFGDGYDSEEIIGLDEQPSHR